MLLHKDLVQRCSDARVLFLFQSQEPEEQNGERISRAPPPLGVVVLLTVLELSVPCGPEV